MPLECESQTVEMSFDIIFEERVRPRDAIAVQEDGVDVLTQFQLLGVAGC